MFLQQASYTPSFGGLGLIHSLSAYYGTGFVAGETGVLLNNRAGRGFFLEQGHPNVIAPGKRTMNTIRPTWCSGTACR